MGWQWRQQDHMQISCTLLQNYFTTQFLQDGCPSCYPTNSVKALKERLHQYHSSLLLPNTESEADTVPPA